VSRSVNKDGLPDLSLFSTVPRCLKHFKTPYIVDSGCPVSRAIVDPFSPALCKAAIAFFSEKDSKTRFGAISKPMKIVNKATK
jgi:hypothetical protein